MKGKGSAEGSLIEQVVISTGSSRSPFALLTSQRDALFNEFSCGKLALIFAEETTNSVIEQVASATVSK